MAKILLVEDDQSLCLFLKKHLKRDGHRVTATSNGAEAYQHIQNTEYDLLLTDYALPEMDGLELVQKAKELQERLKIIFITGFAAVSLDESKKYLSETPQIISKPFHLKVLNEEIKKVLGTE